MYLRSTYINIRAGGFHHIGQRPGAKMCEEADWLALSRAVHKLKLSFRALFMNLCTYVSMYPRSPFIHEAALNS